MTEFFPYPPIPHLVRPQGVDVREDKVLTAQERDSFLSLSLQVEEKLDGENLGISWDGRYLQFQARGSHVQPGGAQFRGIEAWASPREARISKVLGTELILFGEWCAVTHSVSYDALPDWFLVFDVYDNSTGRFWETALRDELAREIGLSVVPRLKDGRFGLNELFSLIGTSRVGHEQMEGVVVRAQDAFGGFQRAKLVRPEFVQQIGRHWRSRPQSRNRLALE